MSKKRIPAGPWKNGLLPDGSYSAVVHEITRCPYGQKGQSYFQIVLWLIAPRRFLVTNIYVPEKNSKSALQRIWHFCRACGCSEKGFEHRLNEFENKHLVVRLTVVSATASGAESDYSDVQLFLAADKVLSQKEREEYLVAAGKKPAVSHTHPIDIEQFKKLDIFPDN